MSLHIGLLDSWRRDVRQKLDVARDIKSECTVIAQTIGSITGRSLLSVAAWQGVAANDDVAKASGIAGFWMLVWHQVFVSATHRSTVNRHHDQHLELLGDGRWRFRPLDEVTVRAGTPV